MTADQGSDNSITGRWQGHYSYSDYREGSRFEAVLTDNAGQIAGSILDDCNLGEAYVYGSYESTSVKFTKYYRQSFLAPVHYSGTISSDRKTMHGKWSISDPEQGVARGTWSAHKIDEEGSKKEQTTENEETVDGELEGVH
ncbi:MAG: hypothetical protein K2Z81_03995 [Cyanobacteria bacterium]|nr:hypothetical protein [Cyanobacteriota bacterium]